LALQALELLISLAVITGLFAMMFKVLPDAEVAWKDVWIGAGLTALLFTVGKFAIGFYLGKSDVGSAYGAAGSLVIVLVWVYYSAQILLFGAEFTQVYANQVGARIVPSKNAMVADPEKAKERGSPDRLPEGRNVDAQPDRKGWAAREATVPSDRQSASGDHVPWWVGLLIIGVSALRSSRRSEK
jgi:membrane protein